MACPLGSWGAMYAKYDIYASTLNKVLHNKAQQSLVGRWDSQNAALIWPPLCAALGE